MKIEEAPNLVLIPIVVLDLQRLNIDREIPGVLFDFFLSVIRRDLAPDDHIESSG